MTPTFIAKAEAELAGIEKQLAGIALLQRRRDQLRTLIALGRQLYLEEHPQSDMISPAPAMAPQAAVHPANSAKSGTQKERILDAIAGMVTATVGQSTRQLVDRLAAQGIEIGGSDKIGSLSAILSRSDLFKSDRAAGGWVLSTSHKEETPTGAPTPEGA